MLSFHTQAFLPASGGVPYLGMAFDGCRFYLTTGCRREVVVTDREWEPEKTMETQRAYTAVCFDALRDCFWAASDQREGMLFRLDRGLRELDGFPLGRGRITGVAFCCDSGYLMAAQGNRLWRVVPETAAAQAIREEPGCAIVCTVACLMPYILYTVLREREPRLVLAHTDGRVLGESVLETLPKSLVPDLCREDGPVLLGLSVHRECYSVMLAARLDKKFTETLCPCTWELSKKCCCKRGGCGDILASIAQQEAALARILNGEGEKLQRAVEEAQNPRELLAVNDSVHRTILYVTQLEQTLLSKMETLRDFGGL